MKNYFLIFTKFVLAILLFPLVFSATVTFQDNLVYYPGNYEKLFLWGALVCMLVYIFIYQLWGVYDFGQKIISDIFKFAAPMDVIIAKMFPFYLIILSLLFILFKKFLKINDFNDYFIFFIGFTLSMHILLSAQELQETEKTAIKPTYLFWMSLIFLVNILAVVLLFDLMFDKSTFKGFCWEVWIFAKNIYVMSFERLSLIKNLFKP